MTLQRGEDSHCRVDIETEYHTILYYTIVQHRWLKHKTFVWSVDGKRGNLANRRCTGTANPLEKYEKCMATSTCFSPKLYRFCQRRLGKLRQREVLVLQALMECVSKRPLLESDDNIRGSRTRRDGPIRCCTVATVPVTDSIPLSIPSHSVTRYFVRNYERTTELRRLCDTLRQHISNLQKYSAAQVTRLPPLRKLV